MLKEPLISSAAKIEPVVQSAHGRFLSEAFYREKLRGFRKYNPETWQSTMKVDITNPFLFVPFIALVVFTTCLFSLSKLIPATLAALSLGPQVHTVLGAALSFLMVFRTNTAYSRWWEARMLWGAVNNNTRSMVCRAPPMMKNEAAYTQLVTELMAFAVTLKNHLRGEKTTPEELGAMLPFALVATLSESVNAPLAAVQALAHTVRNGIKTDAGPDALLASAAFLNLSTSLDAIAGTVGACERVKNTPMPFGYVSSLRMFLMMWLFSMPFTLIGAYGALAIPAMGLVGFLFLNLEMMAMEIEQVGAISYNLIQSHPISPETPLRPDLAWSYVAVAELTIAHDLPLISLACPSHLPRISLAISLSSPSHLTRISLSCPSHLPLISLTASLASPSHLPLISLSSPSHLPRISLACPSQPFGDDPDDLPLEEYCLGIERVCLDFLKRSPFR